MTAGPPVLPTIGDLNRPFWEGCLEGELRLQVCEPAGHVRYPISERCPRCLSTDYRWQPMSGRGEILSWVMFRHAYNPAWAAEVPYNVVLVQLPEGPRMFGNAEPLGADDLAVGEAVHVVFAEPVDGVAVPRWQRDVPGRS
ncbi:MAG TPA: OB-fold domain-containing protein [Candidatus Limnocylindrales bacterium]|nr:OB-fold domain-containing protein [Candidatus Limnocylindrales bacterium]